VLPPVGWTAGHTSVRVTSSQDATVKLLLHALSGVLGLACEVASAQDAASRSVLLLSGQLGAGATYKNHQGAANTASKELTDNLMWGSWLRLSGSEELGDGLRAIFRLESAVSVDTGTAGGLGVGGSKFWNRQSWVGLQMGRAGTVTIGRQYHAAVDRTIRTFDVLNVGGSSLHVVPLGLFGVNRFAANDNRVDNSIKYRLNLPGVLELGASVGAGETVSGRSYSADIARAGDVYDVGAAYIHINAPTRVAATGLLPSHRGWAVGGNARLGPVQPYLAYFDGKLDSTSASGKTQRNKILDAGVAWTVAPLVTLKAAYYHDKGTSLNGVTGRDGTKQTWVVAGYYLLSKRTELYATLFQNRFTDGYRLEAVNIVALNRNPAEAAVSGSSAGIRHSF